MRRCASCGRRKDDAAFPKTPSKRSWCRSCFVEYETGLQLQNAARPDHEVDEVAAGRTKVCPACGVRLELLTDFGRKRRAPSGRQSVCRSCRAEIAREKRAAGEWT